MARERIKKTNAARQLDELGISYELARVAVDESDLSATSVADALSVPYERVYKTIVARGDRTGVLEACVPADAEIDLKALAEASGNKSVAPVPVKELPALTGYIRGGCSPLGSKRKYPVYIEAAAAEQDRLLINAGERGLMLDIAPTDLIRATAASLAPICRGRATRR